MARVRIERKTDWSLRQAFPGDREKIKMFYENNTWKGKDVEILYRWKYEENPFKETLMWIGTDSLQNVISSCVFMPWKFQLNGKAIEAVQLADGVLQLEYRGQGMALELLNRGMKDAREKGMPLAFAFPNENGAAAHRKNNGHHLGHIVRYAKPLRSEYLMRRFIKSQRLLKLTSSIADIILNLFSKERYCINLNRFIIKKAESCGREFDVFWTEFRKKFNDKIITKQDSSYLSWKFLNSPYKNRKLYSLKKDKQIRGFVVLESTPKIGYIIDLLAYDDDVLDYLIVFSIKNFRKEGKDSVVFAALEKNMYFRNFKTFGFIERPEKKHFYIYLDNDIEDRQYLMDSKNWYITIGDCDIESL